MKCECENCGEKVRRQKLIKKIRGKKYCSKCASELRANHRAETINKSGIKDDLRILDNKYKRECQEKRQAEKKRNPIKSSGKNINSPPIPKGNKSKKKKSINTTLTLGEKQFLFRKLRRMGLDEFEAIERIDELIESQRRLKRELKEKNISDDKIKIKLQNLMEDLINY